MLAWENVTSKQFPTYRLAVPAGWLYTVISGELITTTFVPATVSAPWVDAERAVDPALNAKAEGAL